MNLKKLLVCVLCLATMLGAMSITVFADAQADTWDGTADTTWYNDTDKEFTLTTAEQLAGFASLVDGGNNFAGKTVKLGNNIDLYLLDNNGERVSFDPIGDKSAFAGVFDGDEHTIANLYQSGWAFGYEWGSYGSIGLFGEIENATIKNITVSQAYAVVEGGDIGGITGSATGKCIFENITISDSGFGTYNNGLGGIIGWSGAGEYTFKNINIKSDVSLGGLWGSFDSSIGGIVGQGEPGATYNFENVTIECRLDTYNDVTAAYDYYNYRMCGMIIGRLEETITIGGRNYPDMSKYNISCKNVNVTIGEWANYHYCRPEGGRGKRVEAGFEYGGIGENYDHSTCTVHHMEVMPFTQLFGGAQFGVDGADEKILEAQGFDTSTLYVTDKSLIARSIATVDGEYYDELQKAVDAAGGNGTVTLIKDAADSAIIKTPATAGTTGVTIELDGFTLTGNLLVESGATANIQNGTIINKNKDVSAIETHGTTTLTNLDVTSARHAVRVEDGTATINSGEYTLNNEYNLTAHALNVSDGATVVVYDGTFVADGGKSEASAAVKSRDTATVTIYNGKYSNGVYNTLSGATDENIIVYGGMYDQDPTAYVAEGYAALINPITEWYQVGEDENYVANEISIVFEEVTDGVNEDEKLYNINLVATSDINEFASAEFTFVNNSLLSNGKEMTYAITPADNMTLSTTDVKGYYGFAMNGIDDYEISGKTITLGQVRFTGYGEIDFSTADGIVNATTVMNNLVKTFTVGGVANGDVTVGKLVIDSGIIDETITVPTRELEINITFPNEVEGNEAAYQQMSVTIVGGTVNETIALGEEETYAITRDLPYNTTYTVTVSGAGYRTARYSVTLTEDKTLNFWNNVMDNAIEVEEGNTASAVTKNFLAGDIVKDNNINIYDLSAVVSYFGKNIDKTTDADYAKYDLNRDGKIDSKDVAYVLVSWGE